MTESSQGEQQRRALLPLLVGVLVVPAVLGSTRTIFNDGDVSWHIATGQWILHHHSIPHSDPFSFTWFGKPWVAMEPLADVVFAAAYQTARYAGLAAVVTAALIALNWVVFSNAVRWTRYALLPVALMDFVLLPTLFARPHVLTWPLLASWLLLLLRARQEDRAPPLIAALLMTLWANIHGSWVIGLVAAAAFGLEAVVASTNRRNSFRQWLLFGIACAFAVLLNANGLAGVLYPLSYRHLAMLPLISEWTPSNPAVTPAFFAVLAMGLALIAWKRPRLHPVRWLLLAALLALALFQVRQQALLAIAAAMILPRGFAECAPRAPPITRSATAWAAASSVLVVVVRALIPLTPPDNEFNPWKLIAAVPPQLRTQPVLNGYSMGGPLILAGISPYIDGRGDMYGDQLVVGYSRILGGDRQAFNEAVQRWNIRWAILPKSNDRLIALVDRSPGWQRVASDRVGVVYVRSSVISAEK